PRPLREAGGGGTLRPRRTVCQCAGPSCLLTQRIAATHGGRGIRMTHTCWVFLVTGRRHQHVHAAHAGYHLDGRSAPAIACARGKRAEGQEAERASPPEQKAPEEKSRRCQRAEGVRPAHLTLFSRSFSDSYREGNRPKVSDPPT